MSAKYFTLLTFGTFFVIAAAALVFVFAGTEWQGDNNESTWVLFGGFLVYFLAFLTFNRGWGPTEYITCSLLTGVQLLTKYWAYLKNTHFFFFWGHYYY